MPHPDRSLQTGIIALFLGFLPRPLDPFSTLMINGILGRLNAYQKNLLVLSASFSPIIEENVTALTSLPIEGLIFIPGSEGFNQRLAQSGIPLVAVADRAPEIVSVVVDNETGAFMLAEHLALRGHRRVLFRKDLLNHESGVIRYQAFEKAAHYLDMELIATLPLDSTSSLSPEEEGILLGPRGQRPTAVVGWNDTAAYAMLKFCKAHGLGVPEDFAVAGFDGILYPIEPVCQLTTIQAPWIRVAEVAVDILVRQIQGQPVPDEAVLQVDLLIGDTT
jgi:DNA-binding LacI/PurR family transcriptional regulator